ncbi:uroporphyrinogen-III synthase [Sphingobium sp. 3R8]|uniref:uroporphyrinogen-III synthase n=1 Tax=Sphingobium sp. 3R8 TaxID=2874921 RepID=UPI001CCBA1D9|nr:uroporphyrinogen-III synthase [Sphingobium sp. 3R8]MBZ9646427.1 uroporphyrinogen-III synthase [Sphingobium sp. 3R8]
MNRVLILRPEPAAGRTAAKAAALGLGVRVHPLFAPQPADWTSPPASHFDALLLTSAHGVRLAGPGLTAFRGLPTYAVGEATAQALREAGFADVVAGMGDGTAIAARIAADGHRRLLHLGGTTVAPMAAEAIDVTRVAVYSMIALPPDPALVADAAPGSVLLVHSPRAGERLAEQMEQDRRASLHIVAISPAALAACGEGWASGQASALPVDDEMLALAARLCE